MSYSFQVILVTHVNVTKIVLLHSSHTVTHVSVWVFTDTRAWNLSLKPVSVSCGNAPSTPAILQTGRDM
jgi:hypothetical protein